MKPLDVQYMFVTMPLIVLASSVTSALVLRITGRLPNAKTKHYFEAFGRTMLTVLPIAWVLYFLATQFLTD